MQLKTKNADAIIVEVILPLPFDQSFSYIAENSDISIGQIVEVPFRKRLIHGVVIEIKQCTEYNFKLLHIKNYYNLPVIKPQILQFIQKVALYNMAILGHVIKMLLLEKKALDKISKYSDFKKYFIKNNEVSNITLNKEQEAIEKKIYQEINDKPSVSLLNGVTGSGKTEVYLTIAQKLINSNAQILILLPEIVLTAQMLDRFTKRLKNCSIAQWHSGLTPKSRNTIWHGVITGKINVIVGARSALFLPFVNLKLIILDEEHDSSFKQEEGVVYNARDMAVLKAQEENIPIILSSATPSVESYYNTKQKKYSFYHLSSRFSGVRMPEVKIIDLNKYKNNYGEWLSQPLREELKNTLKMKKQSLLFLNRRGYAPLVLCNHCGHKFSCPHCNFWLVEHRKKNTLQCHYCGYTKNEIKECQECGSSDRLVAIGPGVERIEEEVNKLFPNARVATLTSDTIKSFKEAEKVISAIENHDIDILIGTQMLAKGLHFSKLHMVGVVEADTGYFSGDIRILERTYQLLYQVSGRAGRENEKGLVLLQSYEPENLVLQNLVKQNYKSFINKEIEDREKAEMPPFSKLVIIKGISKHENDLESYMRQLVSIGPKAQSIEIFGPSPAPITKLRDKYRYRIIVKSKKDINIQKVIKQWIAKLICPSTIKIKIDIDPYNFM